MVFELMCGKLYCGGRCYMSYAGSPLYIRTHKDVQNLTEAKYPCSERRLVLMDAVLYFAMRDHLPFAEPVPHLEEHHRLFLVSYISMVEKLMVILRRYFDENVPRTQRAAESWVKLQTPIAKRADVDSKNIVRYAVPVAQKAEVPVAQKAEVPVAQNTEVPVAQNAEVPVAQNAEVPVAQNAEVPVAQNAEGPVSQKVKAPVVNVVDETSQYIVPLPIFCPDSLAGFGNDCADFSCRVSSGNIRHGVFAQIKPLP